MQLRLLLSLCLTVVFAGACDSPVEVGGDDDLSAGVGVGDERLLSDAEMRVLPDAAAPDENPAWAEWVRANHEPVRSLTSGNFADLEFLKPLLQHARIVQLGESTHGAAEYSLAKTRLIRFLHQEMGFEVLAFESSLLECYMAGLRVGTATPRDLLRDCLFGVWHVAEALPLLEYIASTRGSDRPLIMAGFDVQVSGNAFRSRPQWVREVVAAADPAMADSAARVEARLVELATLAPTERLPLIAAEGAAMSRFYLDLAALLTERAAAVRAAFPERPGMAAIAVQHARMAPVYIEVLGAPNASAAHPIRDRGMATTWSSCSARCTRGRRWSCGRTMDTSATAGSTPPDAPTWGRGSPSGTATSSTPSPCTPTAGGCAPTPGWCTTSTPSPAAAWSRSCTGRS